MSVKCCAFLLHILIVCSLEAKADGEISNLYNAISVILKDSMIVNNNNIALYVNYKHSSKKLFHYFNDIVNGLVAESKNYTFKILYQSLKMFQNFQHKEVILLDNFQSFYSFYKQLYNTGTMNLSYTIMFISSLTTFDTAAIESMFRDLYHMSILNIALIVQLSDGDIILVTYFPFSPTACYTFTPVVINKYNATQQMWTDYKYFPKKVHNFHGCPLTCASWEEMPYLAFKGNECNNTIIVTEYEGFEGKIMEFAANAMNFTTRIYIMSAEEIAGTFNKPASTFGKILSNYADFAIGGFYYDANIDELTYVQTMYYYLSNVFIITNVFNAYTTYEKLAFPFQANVWYSVGFIFAFSSVVIYACTCSSRTRQQRNFTIGATNRTPNYHLFVVAMGGGMSSFQLPRYNFARFLLTCWILATLILRSAYQSGMYQLLRDNKRRNPPQTIADVIEQNYAIVVLGLQKRFLDSLHLKNVRDVSAVNFELFQNVAYANEPIGVVVPFEYYGYLRKVIPGTMQHIHLVKERIFTQQLAMYVRHNSYLVNELNTHIANAQYFGFITLWARNYFGSPSNDKNHVATEEQTNILSMHELGAVFMILLWLHVIAIMVIVIEIMWHKWKRLQMSRGEIG